jgi:uncharacterized protein involved in exopolysaccharide biosynthesis
MLMNDTATRTDRTGGTDSTYDQDVTLSELLQVLWRYRLVLVAVPAAAGILILLISWTRTPLFQASSRLLVSPSKIGDDVSQPVSLSTYQALISNQSLILEVMKSLRLTEPPHGLTASEALRRNVTVEAVRDADILLITTRLRDPGLAAQFANRLAERSVQAAKEIAQDDVIAARDTIKVQLDESRGRLEATERQLITFRKQAHLEALSADVDALIAERAKTLPLLVAIEAERARVRQTSEELARQEPVRNARRSLAPSIVAGSSAGVQPAFAAVPRVATRFPRDRAAAEREPAGREAAGVPRDSTGTARDSAGMPREPGIAREREGIQREPAGSPREPASAPRVSPGAAADSAVESAERDAPPLAIRDELLDPFVNPVYEILNQQLAASRTKLSELESQRAEIIRATDLSTSGAKKLNDLYTGEAELERLRMEADVARRAYLDVSTRYEQARLQVAARSPQLQIIDVAVPAQTPVTPRTLRDTALALVVTLVLTCAAILVYAAVSEKIAVSRVR